MKEAPVKVEARPVTPDDFEDLLATNDLFIEYFNSFLALPSFPEPLFFNKETGGFEIVTDAKEKLATEIKAAVRAGRPKKKIYRAVRRHAFMPVPLIPMEEPAQEETREIDTSFVVQTLNKEQGIEWIKKERLPTFLESECYLEYRLAHIVSQCQVIHDSDEPVALKIDHSPWPVTTKAAPEEEDEEPDEDELLLATALAREALEADIRNLSPIPREDPLAAVVSPTKLPPIPPPWVASIIYEESEIDEEPTILVPNKGKIMKDLFVCMGSASTTDTEAWVSQAKMAHTMVSPSVSIRPRPVSAALPNTTNSLLSRPMSGVSGRPISSLSQADSTWRDSGIGSPTKMSLQGSILDMGGYANSIMSQDDKESLSADTMEPQTPRAPNDEGALDSKLFGADSKPITPRPCDTVCMVVEGGSRRGGGTAYILPPTSPLDEDNESISPPPSTVPTETASQRSSLSPDPVDDCTVDNSTTDAKKPSLVFENIDELGSVIVGAVLKQAVANTTGEAPEDIVKTNQLIRDLYPSDSMSRISVEDLDRVELSSVSEAASKAGSIPDEDRTDSGSARTPSGLPVSHTKSFELTKATEAESDEDSLLDSDDDYDDVRDKIFKKKTRKYKLVNSKGIEKFKKFLRTTQGEKNWFFWLDIDRGRILVNGKEGLTSGYLSAMRERYQRPGALFELPRETKQDFGLVEPSSWTMEKLQTIQNKVAQPLLLYWGPRFLLRQVTAAQPRKNYLYNQQKSSAPLREAHPNPATIPLLPLRPKTCMPRLRQMEPPQMQVTSMFDDPEPPVAEKPSTTPNVGMKRAHSLQDVYRTNKKKDKEKLNLEKQKRTKTPKQLVSKRPQTARKPDVPKPPSHSRPSWSAQPRSTRSSDQWETFSNISMPSTIRSDTGKGVPRNVSPGSETSEPFSEISEFKGGRRMEGLLQALSSEKRAGGVIQKYLETTCNQLWMDCLSFWHDLQDYHRFFYAEVLDDYLLVKKAKFIFSKYVVAGASHNIHCSPDVRSYIHDHLVPPYEELFDAAEEYVFEMLYDAWSQMIVCDMSTFDKVELIEVKRHIDGKSKYMVTLQKKGIIKERPATPDDPMGGYQDPVYDDALLEQIPEEFKDYTLEQLVHNRIELEHFRQFLEERHTSMDLSCWLEIEAFRRTPHNEERKRDHKARDVKTKYLNKKYFFGPNSPAGKEGQDKVMAVGGGWGKILDDRPPTATVLEVQKYARTRLEKKWLPLFLATPDFAERQRPKSSMDDVVEDVMIQKKKKSQAIWRMLESRWVSSSKDVITFRKALLNPITSHQFRRFVSIKGDNYENDVLFWQEVQRYKDLCHLHSDRSLIQQKTVTIVNCFIDSPIPPQVQVDITQEMADKIVDRKLEATPYLFREAQLTVFRVLFPYWSDFCKFRLNLAADKILPTIERHRRRAKAEERRRQEEARERKEKLKKQKRKMKKMEKQLEQERLVRENQDSLDAIDSNPDKPTVKKVAFLDQEEGEIANRRALGLPVTVVEEDHFREPHEVPSSGEEDVADVGSTAAVEGDEGNKDQVTWSYSGYMKALEEEKVLNEVDEATFSGVSDASKTVLFSTQPEEDYAPRSDHIDLSDDPPIRRGSLRKSSRQDAEENPRSRPTSAGSQNRSRASRPKSSRIRDPENSHHDHVTRPPVPPEGGASRKSSRRTHLLTGGQ